MKAASRNSCARMVAGAASERHRRRRGLWAARLEWGLLSIVQVVAAHGQQHFVQIPPKLTTIPYSLDMTALERVA